MADCVRVGKVRNPTGDDDADVDEDNKDSDDANSSDRHHHHHHHFHYHHHHESQVNDYDTIEDTVSQLPSHDSVSSAAVSSPFFSYSKCRTM